ncbi:conserved hypothetical protein [Ricinus communis]|uniref:Dienelactone hydrolase domain-containing protein n=1 Tax=Ricinus communis TaxID=3988 RepID=B9TGH3_RICCO|nr:conserved hypothetical protein [Ricinus communis]
MTVFCPSLFGEPGKGVTKRYIDATTLRLACVRREFAIWRGGRSSPVVDWLKALARKAHAECGGRGVGAVGMCFTGGFALAMMTEPSVVRQCWPSRRCRCSTRAGSTPRRPRSPARRRASKPRTCRSLPCATSRTATCATPVSRP